MEDADHWRSCLRRRCRSYAELRHAGRQYVTVYLPATTEDVTVSAETSTGFQRPTFFDVILSYTSFYC